MEKSLNKFRPILFSTPMVQAILENRKRQTRRTKGLEKVNENPDDWKFEGFGKNPDNEKDKRLCAYFTIKGTGTWYYQICPYKVGDVLWVRENYYTASNWDHWKPSMLNSVNVEVFYVADLPNYDIPRPLSRGKIRPCIFLPKEYARIFLKIKSIKVERLQDISEEDAIAEGVIYFFNPLFQETRFKDYMISHSECREASRSFCSLWESINRLNSWNHNPYVFVYEFEQIEKPLDFIV